jgi:hypothetical protein
MLQKVGLLPPGNKESIRAAYELYAREDQEGLDLCKDFKASFAIQVDVQFVGVFDTVASVGMIPHTLPFVSTNDGIRIFRQAFALDERRVLASCPSSLRGRLTPCTRQSSCPSSTRTLRMSKIRMARFGSPTQKRSSLLDPTRVRRDGLERSQAQG